MKLLFDTNVVLDVLLDRKPHSIASGALWNSVERKKCQGVLAAHCITTIHYLISKHSGAFSAGQTIRSLQAVFGVASVDGHIIGDAMRLEWVDFEDAVTAAAAIGAGCDAIVTRDPKGFSKSALPVLTPETASILISN